MRSPKIPLENIEKYLLKEPQDLNKLLEEQAFSGIELEIGSGNGQFLIEVAKANPDKLVVGCEIDWIRIKKTVKRCEDRGLKNVRLHYGKAELFLEWFQPESMDKVYLNFPDPWPKKRHHKHRFLFDPKTLDKVHEKLKTQGRFYFVSDHQEYFFFGLEERLKVHKGLTCPFEKGYVPELEGYFSTLYEEKFKSEGKPIYYTYFVKEEV